MASQNGHHDVVQSLLGAGAEVNIATSDVSDVTCVHRVHVHVYCGEDRGEAQHGVPLVNMLFDFMVDVITLLCYHYCPKIN